MCDPIAGVLLPARSACALPALEMSDMTLFQLCDQARTRPVT